jgi:hypothetical protein
VLGNGIPFVGAPFDHPIGKIVVQMVDDAKMLEGATTFFILLKIII